MSCACRYQSDEASSAALHDSVEDCTSCAAGKMLSDDGTSRTEHDSPNDCTNCDAGKTSEVGSATCTDCTSGKVSATVHLNSNLHLLNNPPSHLPPHSTRLLLVRLHAATALAGQQQPLPANSSAASAP